MLKKSLGICLGASTIKVVELSIENNNVAVSRSLVKNHECNPRESFLSLISELDCSSYDYGMITGRKFRTILDTPSITEPEAVENALAWLRQSGDHHPYRAVASLGAENFIVYVLDNDGNVATVETGNKCASGTGEFFLQQIRRMDITVDEAVSLAAESDLYKVSGRCSVFCKSDCTHALNKGVPIGRVTAGLCSMMADKILDLLEKADQTAILAVGGVTNNRAVMQYLKKKINSLEVPRYADTFEALGAAYYAYSNSQPLNLNPSTIFRKRKSSFDQLPPIAEGGKLVRFETVSLGTPSEGDECLLGLDVGSTTTKAVVMRIADDAVLASVYLRTNGNPVKASRECYQGLVDRLPVNVEVAGIGVTGSGRQIAGLHAQTDGVINEIIAHATAAAHYDPEVDTIFEIGGQDAKYTYLVNGVPSDYAMNEACSAGTGSFLEESAKESLGIDYKEIQHIALQSRRPPNFNDQCAAFISSDIKTATHEGINKEDIVAGLVYSICMNYVNRVKGQRGTGKKIFMQGGVCYNRGIPLAMANLIGKPIVVPPEPGLMGAFGVALEVKHRIGRGVLNKKRFDLRQLAEREIQYGKSFICTGGGEKCDRGCEISMMSIEGRKYPFGGACNKYYNLIHHVHHDQQLFDWVRVRQNLLFGDFLAPKPSCAGPTIGISRSFLTNMLLPLYSHFFSLLGYTVVLSDTVDPDGIKRKRTTYCFPAEIAHGCFADLQNKKLDYIFLPKVIELFVENALSQKREHQSTCLLLQSEPYCLKSAFKQTSNEAIILSPTLDFSKGFVAAAESFMEIALQLGKNRIEAENAFRIACRRQQEWNDRLKQIGRHVLAEIAQSARMSAIVLLGRPYNAFAREANLNIPAKFASRGVHVIPWDFLPIENERIDMDMCWAIGQNLMKAAQFVQKHPQLFATYITNFSCGPDSFLVGYFRDIMGIKPSLTLELDSHTADAGVNTRIEAFLDIVAKYRELAPKEPVSPPFTPAQVVFEKGKIIFISSRREAVALNHPRVKLLFPSMGKLCSESMAAVFTGCGIRSEALPVYDNEALKRGRGTASCKECLPLLLTTGGLLEYLAHRPDNTEYLVYFMPTTPGNCRFTQYNIFLKKMIAKNRIENVAFLSLTNENGYAGLAVPDMLNALKSTIISDCMEDIKNALIVLAKDKLAAQIVFEEQWNRILTCFSRSRGKGIMRLLEDVAERLAAIPLRYPLHQAKIISLLGEIFVRREYFSCQDIVQRLAERDIIVRRAHVLEWLNYCDWNVKKGIYEADFSFRGRLEFKTKTFLMKNFEKKIKRILARSGLYEYEIVDIDAIMEYGKQFFDVRFTGEAILVVGVFFKDILRHSQGVISIGPFACMPTRVIEAVLSAEATMETKIKLDARLGHAASDSIGISSLPFLSVESDGNPFPQIIEARIEAFCLQVERLHSRLRAQQKNAEPIIAQIIDAPSGVTMDGEGRVTRKA